MVARTDPAAQGGFVASGNLRKWIRLDQPFPTALLRRLICSIRANAARIVRASGCQDDPSRSVLLNKLFKAG